MEHVLVLLLAFNLLMFAFAGMLLVGAINKTKELQLFERKIIELIIKLQRKRR